MSAVEIHLLPESEPSPEGFARKDPMHLGVEMVDEGSGAREDELVPQRERAEDLRSHRRERTHTARR